MNRTLKTLSALALLALATTGAQADTAAQRVEIEGAASATALAAAPGSYKMANGKILSLTRSHNGVYAQLNEGATKELLLVDRNRLRSKDGRMEVAVELDRYGEVQNVTMTLLRA